MLSLSPNMHVNSQTYLTDSLLWKREQVIQICDLMQVNEDGKLCK